MKLPPNPVSMSAISGGPLPGARFAIMSAFDFMSYSWARARSGFLDERLLCLHLSTMTLVLNARVKEKLLLPCRGHRSQHS